MKKANVLVLLAVVFAGALLSVSAQGDCGCADTPPPSGSCEDQKNSGNCNAGWMLGNGYCQATCGRCFCVGDCACYDSPPDSAFTCAQQKSFNQCPQKWMIDGGFCKYSCGRCDCNNGAQPTTSPGKPAGKPLKPVAVPGAKHTKGAAPAKPAPAAKPAAPKPKPKPKAPAPEVKPNVFVPCNGTTVLGFIKSNPNLTSFADIIAVFPDVAEQLDRSDMDITVFAPNNKGLSSFFEEQNVTPYEMKTNYKTQLKGLIYYHLVPLARGPNSLHASKVIPTIWAQYDLYPEQNSIAAIRSTADVVSYAKVCNDVVYTIDDVLLPTSSVRDIPEFKLPKEVEQKKQKECSYDETAWQAIKSRPELSTLKRALESTDLVPKLDDRGRSVTVFAPTNQAFEALSKNLSVPLSDLLAPKNSELLTEILRYHMLYFNREASSLQNQEYQTMNRTTPLFVNLGSDGDNKIVVQGLNTDATVTAPDIDNSCISAVHEINAVLMPFRTSPFGKPANAPKQPTPASGRRLLSKRSGCKHHATLIDGIEGKPQFSSLLQAIDIAHLKSKLQNTSRSFTLFAPDNKAFDKLAKQLGTTTAKLLTPKNKALLKNIIRYHVLNTVVEPSEFKNETFKTMNKVNTLNVVKKGNGVIVQGVGSVANVEPTNLATSCSAAVYEIDTVLLPLKPTPTLLNSGSKQHVKKTKSYAKKTAKSTTASSKAKKDQSAVKSQSSP